MLRLKNDELWSFYVFFPFLPLKKIKPLAHGLVWPSINLTEIIILSKLASWTYFLWNQLLNFNNTDFLYSQGWHTFLKLHCTASHIYIMSLWSCTAWLREATLHSFMNLHCVAFQHITPNCKIIFGLGQLKNHITPNCKLIFVLGYQPN